MRRIVFYFGIALLAFAFGAFIFFGFNWKSKTFAPDFQEKTKANLNGDTKEILTLNSTDNLSSPENEIKFTCDDEILTAVLNDLKKDNDFNKSARTYFKNDEFVNCREILHIKQFIDLNNDGIKEADIRPHTSLICGVSGNCMFWIYQKDGKHYKKLLEMFGVGFEINQLSTKGYQDIMVKEHASCCSSYLTKYKFNGNEYVEDSCLFTEGDGTMLKASKPCETARTEEDSSVFKFKQ